MCSEYTTYAYDNDTAKEFIVKTENGTFEWVEKEASDYEKYVDDAIALWIAAGKTYSEEEDYEIINMEERELLPELAMGNITVDYNTKRGLAWTDADNYDENDTDKKITEWTITINLYWFEKRNDDGTYYYSDEDKAKIIAHEIGHVYGLNHFKDEDYKEQIMYFKHKKNSSKEITENDIYGMELCTEAFTSQEWVLVGTEETCQKFVCTGKSGDSYTIKYDHTHSWTDDSDTTCNDCSYMRPIAVEEVDGLITATLDGQGWIINSLGAEELQYNTSYTLPCNVPVEWVNVGGGTPYNRYCYNGYIYGDQYISNPLRFANLREMTKILDKKNSRYYKLRYILDRPDARYKFQWIQTTKTLQGGFYAQLLGDEVNGYYVKIYRVLVDGAGNKYHYAEVWSPEMRIPVYFSH